MHQDPRKISYGAHLLQSLHLWYVGPLSPLSSPPKIVVDILRGGCMHALQSKIDTLRCLFNSHCFPFHDLNLDPTSLFAWSTCVHRDVGWTTHDARSFLPLQLWCVELAWNSAMSHLFFFNTMVPSPNSLLLCLPWSSTTCNRQNNWLYIVCNHSSRGQFLQSKTNALWRPFSSTLNWHRIKPCRTSSLFRLL